MKDIDIGPVFRAAYSGECADCFDIIDEDDRVRYVDGELVHADCAPDDDEPFEWGRKLEVVK